MDFEDCEFNGNTHAGLILEVVLGPVHIKNCAFNNNWNGIQIETSYNVFIEHSEIKNNGGEAIRFTTKYREGGVSDWPGAGSFNLPVGSWWHTSQYETIMGGVEDIKIHNCIIGSSSGNAKMYGKNTVASDRDYYDLMLNGELDLANNQYYHPFLTNVFDIDVRPNFQTLTNFAQWKNTAGTDFTSTFTTTNLTDVSPFINARLVEENEDSFAPKANFSLYPNPVGPNGFKVKTRGISEGVIQVLDLKGQVVDSKSFFNQEVIEFNKSMSKGIYLVQIKTGVGTISKKLLVQ